MSTDKYHTALDEVLQRNEACINKLAETHYNFLYKAYKNIDSDILFERLHGNEDTIELPSKGGFILINKISSSINTVIYHAEFSYGSTILRHYHSDCDQIVKNKSECDFRIELGSGEDRRILILRPNGLMTIYANTRHQITALDKEGKLEISYIKIRR